MKYLSIIAVIFLLCSCYSSKHISKFSITQLHLGVTKDNFISKYGKPFNQEVQYNQDNQLEEKLFYKEELYQGGWYVVTTAFFFQNSQLTKQEIVKEEQQFQNCKCDDTK